MLCLGHLIELVNREKTTELQQYLMTRSVQGNKRRHIFSSHYYHCLINTNYEQQVTFVFSILWEHAFLYAKPENCAHFSEMSSWTALTWHTGMKIVF